jgi:hypothetical protein
VNVRLVLRAAAALAGVALFVQALRLLGLERLVDGLGRVGWGFAAIVALSGAREAVRTLAWIRTVEGPVPLRFAQAFRARLAGEALNALLPIGMVVGEPTKASHVSSYIPFSTACSALAVEFAFYCLSLVPMFCVGFSAYALVMHIGPSALVVALGISAAAIFALLVPRVRRNWPVAAQAAPGRESDNEETGASTDAARSTADRLRHLGNIVFGFASRHPEHLRAIAACEIAFHILAVAEVYFTLRFVSPVRPTLASAIVLETVDRAITMMFKMLPMRVGVDEAGSSLFAVQVQLDAATGVTLALVRKLRVLVWSAVGLALLVRRPPLHAPAGARS